MRYLIGFVAFLAVVSFEAVLFLGGVKYGSERYYRRGMEDGIHITITAANRLLGDVNSRYFLRYTPEDNTYHLVIKEGK